MASNTPHNQTAPVGQNDEYRELNRGETIQAGDEICIGGQWEPVCDGSINVVVGHVTLPVRRRVGSLADMSDVLRLAEIVGADLSKGAGMVVDTVRTVMERARESSRVAELDLRQALSFAIRHDHRLLEMVLAPLIEGVATTTRIVGEAADATKGEE